MYTDPLRGQEAPAYPGSGVQAFDDNAEGQGGSRACNVEPESAEDEGRKPEFQVTRGISGKFLIGGHLKISEGGHPMAFQ